VISRTVKLNKVGEVAGFMQGQAFRAVPRHLPKGETMESLEQTLARHPFFTGLEKRFLPKLARLASHKRFEPEQMIFHEGQPAKELYLICRGKIGIETALLGMGNLVVESLGAGEVVGWSWMLPPYEYHYSARALEPTEVIALDGKALHGQCESDHDLGYEMMKRFALVIVRRLAATRAQLLHYPDPSRAPEPARPWPIRVVED
jgi:CRP-like cAMP-binding protein